MVEMRPFWHELDRKELAGNERQEGREIFQDTGCEREEWHQREM